MPVSVTPLDLGLLALRLYGGGTMCVVHGWGKLTSFPSAGFPDPFGIGATPSHGLVVLAEVLCAVLVAAGAFTRLATVPLIVTMAVAGFYIHGGDPWQKKELAFTYLAIYVALLGTGPGRLSVDARVRGKRV